MRRQHFIVAFHSVFKDIVQGELLDTLSTVHDLLTEAGTRCKYLYDYVSCSMILDLPSAQTGLRAETTFNLLPGYYFQVHFAGNTRYIRILDSRETIQQA